MAPQNEFNVGIVQTLHVHPGESAGLTLFLQTLSVSLFCHLERPCVLQRCHNYMTDQLGIPVWGSYVIFGLVTLFSGLALGLVGSTRRSPCFLLSHLSCVLHTSRDQMFLFPSRLQLLVFIADFVFPSRRFSAQDYHQSEFPLRTDVFWQQSRSAEWLL